jgi:OOP family OmpA-OmpF porin
MNKKLVLALSLAGLAGMTAAHADETTAAADEVAAVPAASTEFLDDRFYLAPFGTFYQPGGDSKGFGGWGAGLGIGKIINEYFNVEIRGFWQNYGNNIPAAGGHVDQTGGTADLQYFFFRDTFSPYAVLALGGENTSFRTVGKGGWSGASFLWETGVGATYELADNFLLRGDVRYRGYTQPNNSIWFGNNDVLNNLVVNLGFVIPLGEKPTALAAAPVAECVRGNDTDHDGVDDCDDKCPGTMANAKVDDQGCPIVMELRGVNFKFDSDELTEGAKSILDGVVEQLVAFPEKRDIEVAGFASYEGRPQAKMHNLKLSQRRSESVARYLKAKGVTNKLYAKGYGTEYPIASNDTEEGRIKNRRVELRWMGD